MGDVTKKWGVDDFVERNTREIRNVPKRFAGNMETIFDRRSNTVGGIIGRAGRDIVEGTGEAIRTGSPGRLVGGAASLVTGGLTEKFFPTTTTQEMQAEAAQVEEAQMEQDTINARTSAKRKAIETRIAQEVALRQRSPGKSQTLLTAGNYGTGSANLFPSGNNTLLSLGKK